MKFNSQSVVIIVHYGPSEEIDTYVGKSSPYMSLQHGEDLNNQKRKNVLPIGTDWIQTRKKLTKTNWKPSVDEVKN